MHDAGVGTDAMDRLCLSSIGTFLENLAVGAIGAVLVSHFGDWKLCLELCWLLASYISAVPSGPSVVV